VGRIDPRQKYLPMPLNHLRDAKAFDNVGANAEDRHGRGFRVQRSGFRESR